MGYALGKGTTLSFNGTAVGQIVSLSPHSGEFGQVETTDLNSTVRTFLPTILDPGEITFVLSYDDAVAIQATLETAYLAGTVGTWLATFTNTGATTWSASGFVKMWRFIDHTVESLSQVTVTVKLTGTLTVTP